jgi:hypothetical protein
MIEEFFRVHRKVKLDDGMDTRSKIFIRQADHRAGRNGPVFFQRRLNLGRIDVRASDQDHVGTAIRQVEIALAVAPSSQMDLWTANLRKGDIAGP